MSNKTKTGLIIGTLTAASAVNGNTLPEPPLNPIYYSQAACPETAISTFQPQTSINLNPNDSKIRSENLDNIAVIIPIECPWDF
ncbi:MAG: hypothetical protein ACXVCR_01310 [Bdellovibrio sp.]